MRTALISLFVVLGMALPAWADEAPARKEAIEVLLRTSVESRDIRQLGYVPRAQPVLRTELGAKLPTGWNFCLVGLAGLSESREEGQKTASDELNFAAGRRWKMGELTLAADIVYLAPRPTGKADGDTVYPRLRVGTEIDLGARGSLKPYVQGELRLSVPDLVRRPVGMIGVDHQCPIGGPLLLRSGVSVLYDHGVDGVAETGWVVAGRVALEWRLSDAVATELFIRVSEPYQLRDRQTEHSVGLALTLKF